MSPTSTNRSPRHRLTDVGDSDFGAVKQALYRHLAVTPCRIPHEVTSQQKGGRIPHEDTASFSY
ncbi:MAG: hypothetical protein K2H04_09930 [Bacteroidaceae bacterium]|nr:hypothetical protein [Bacteroidaceae bacterium]